MSMISSQCDELRDAAKRGGLVVGLPQMLNEAADLILELRDDLQRANDAMRDAEHDESMAWDRVRKAEAESAKLRELAGALLTSHEKMCTQRGHCFGCTFFYEEVKACPYVKISRTLRELGIEVN